MDDFTSHSLFSISFDADADASPSTLISSLDASSCCNGDDVLVPPVNEEVIHGTGTYSWCTIA